MLVCASVYVPGWMLVFVRVCVCVSDCQLCMSAVCQRVCVCVSGYVC